ncbi:MAG: C25 family cysteine peptidase [Acidobacteriota bacterium]
MAEPGAYSVAFEAIAPYMQGPEDEHRGVASASLKLTFRDQSLPLWIDDGGDGRLGPGERVVFLAPHDRLWPPSLRYETPRAVLQLHFDGSGPENFEGPGTFDGTTAETAASTVGTVATTPETEPLAPRRLLRFEQDRLRLPATREAPLDGLESLWFWATISERSSAAHEIDLGSLPDRARSHPLDLEIRARVVGWSNPEVPVGETQHHVELRIDERPITASRWDGRRAHDLRFSGLQSDGLPERDLDDSGHRLTLAVPSRPDGAGDPIIDLVYVDWVEVEYRVDRGTRHASAPLRLSASAEARWLPGDEDSANARLLAEAGWSATFEHGGWALPPTAATDVWIVGDGELREPLAISPTAPAPAPRAGVDYLMIAPSALQDGARTLAAIHERRGLAVDVVDARAVFDTYDWGRRSPEAIRAFLDAQLGRSPALRYVLLLGDADWFTPSDDAVGADESWELPSGIQFSESGPAASDHVFAASDQDSTSPRFAVGRLPIADAAELDAWVDKIRSYLESPTSDETVLMVSDSTRVSLGRSRRVRERLVERGRSVRVPEADSQQPLDRQLIAAFDPMPAIVHFSGHGSRHTWQLGDSFGVSGAAFFERDEVARLPATRRPPMVVSVSCATAPFDHPSAESLGERMVLRPDGGAIAFLGASARLYTQPRFGELIVRALLDGRSIGDAVVAAKREVDSAETSALYNLLGDPSLGIR